MGIRESLLNTITSVGNGDFIRIVTSAGASSKATLANVFKSFESGLGAKSNLGTSDYIRVVGSDNVSYKQGVASVKTALGIDALTTCLGGLKMVTMSKVVTISAGSAGSPTDVTVTFDEAPGAFQGVMAYLGGYYLPYIGANGAYTSIYQTSGKTITIRNTAGNWNNYRLYVIGFFNA